MMYRVVLLVAVLACVALGHRDKECMKLLHPSTMKCCKTELPQVKDETHDEMKECFKSMPPPPHPPKPPSPPPCDIDICLAKKRGYAASEDGKFDKIALKANVEQEFEQMPEMTEAIIKNCVEGDLSSYGPPDLCDLGKMRHCIHSTMLMACPDWDDTGSCSGTKELIEKCIKNNE